MTSNHLEQLVTPEKSILPTVHRWSHWVSLRCAHEPWGHSQATRDRSKEALSSAQASPFLDSSKDSLTSGFWGIPTNMPPLPREKWAMAWLLSLG